MKFFSTYFWMLLLPGFFFSTLIRAQNKNENWFDQTYNRIESNDTNGIYSGITAHFKKNNTPDGNSFLGKLILADYYITYRKFDAATITIKECHHLDSLLQIDSLKGILNYIEGFFYFTQDNYPIALPFLNRAALAFNNKPNSLLQARCFGIRGLIQESLHFPDDAEKSFLTSLAFYRTNKICKREAGILNNLGIINTQRRDSVKASMYLLRSLAVLDSTGDLIGVGRAYNNLGELMYQFGHYDIALDYYKRAYDFRLKGKAPESGTIESNINIGKALHKAGSQAEAKIYLEKAFTASENEPDFLELKRRACQELMQICFEMKDYKRAYEMQSIYYFANDSLYGVSKKEEILKLSVQYDFENKQKQDSLRRSEHELALTNIREEKEKRTNIIMIALLCGLGLAGFFVYNLYKSNQEKKKSNEIISSQRDILDKKQQEITESIQYAKYIQQALLPDRNILAKNLPEHFILYRPKDIVSGDFYWFNLIAPHRPPQGEGQGGALLLAVADCTGHGVPGAFMSLLGKENLDKAAGLSKRPGEILSLLNRSVRQSLKQNSGEQGSRDGMDIALIRVEKTSAGTNLIFSGANRPLWIFRKGENSFSEIKSDKVAIGGFTPDEQQFTEHLIDISTGDTLYLFSDGFADQFGGEKQKKLTTKKFRELISGLQTFSMKEQEEKFSTYFDSWKGKLEQVDDILVIGIRI